MQPIRIIFFGTHTFATYILQALIAVPDFSVDLILTQPDKPVGRKQIYTSPPVKLLAEKQKKKVKQPKSLQKYILEKNKFDIGITAQYGLLIPQHILDIPTQGILNVHTSLLPKYRGATPIQSAILNGDKKTGVTFMRMDAGLDTGPFLTQEKVDIDPHEKQQDLELKLAYISSQHIENVIRTYMTGKLKPQPQNNKQASTCKKLTRDDGRLHVFNDTKTIYNQYRALTPWPGIWTMWNHLRLKLLEIKPSTKKIPPGEVYKKNTKLLIGTADGSIEIIRIQKEGKQATDAQNFLNGNQNILGSKVE